MSANWLSHSSDVSRGLTAVLEQGLRTLSRPENLRRLRRVLIILLALWAVLALSRLIWALLPAADTDLPPGAEVLNPVNLATPTGDAPAVDIERLQSWHLFGEAGVADPVATGPAPSAAVRQGIEEGARATRLDLRLRGVVASSEEGLGYAIIEHKSRQDIYAVEDKLPVPGRVTLAKVLPGRVVLDNGGTYELLELFEESPLAAQVSTARNDPQAPTAEPQQIRPGDSATSLARDYRDRLYQNPQTLAEVVTVSAVRENGELRGYRIAPGKEREQFELLGFKPGDLVTSVNGIALDDPANTLRLYQAMRSASEAVFELQRNDQPLTVSVSLGDEQ